MVDSDRFCSRRHVCRWLILSAVKSLSRSIFNHRFTALKTVAAFICVLSASDAGAYYWCRRAVFVPGDLRRRFNRPSSSSVRQLRAIRSASLRDFVPVDFSMILRMSGSRNRITRRPASWLHDEDFLPHLSRRLPFTKRGRCPGGFATAELNRRAGLATRPNLQGNALDSDPYMIALSLRKPLLALRHYSAAASEPTGNFCCELAPARKLGQLKHALAALKNAVRGGGPEPGLKFVPVLGVHGPDNRLARTVSLVDQFEHCVHLPIREGAGGRKRIAHPDEVGTREKMGSRVRVLVVP